MFLNIPFSLSANLQHIVLIINTVLLIAALIIFELVYAEKPKKQRRGLRYFLPLLVALVGLFVYAAFRQFAQA